MPVYVQHEALGKVNDVFNAEAIWQAPGLAMFARRPLLRDLLERSPREHRGRAPTRCFSHVTLLLAQDEVDDDRHLTRGARVRDLAQSLRALHQKDFGDLLGSDDVRYDVVGTEALEAGQVKVKFGHAVYLPAAGEQALYQVETSSDGCNWERICAIYPEQRLALIGRDADLASHAVSGWPFGADGAILLVNDGPDAPIEVQVRPKGAFSCSLDDSSNCYQFDTVHAGVAVRLLMKVTRVAAPKKPAAAVWKQRDPDATALPPPTLPAPPAISEGTYAPITQQSVTLVALALPRLSRYRDTGATSLDIGLDQTCALSAHGAAPAISFSIDAADQLMAVSSGQRQPVCAPASFTPPGSAKVELLEAGAALQDRYCALLKLGAGPVATVPGGARFVFGRSTPMLAALRLLDSGRFLQGAGGASADRLGLSRNAFSFEVIDGGFSINRLSATQALYHLDAQLHFVACIGENGQPYTLPAGHHLVAGHYVLRFDA